jgi:catechol 2,3-dioxygenase-like lactoylglutathione lyase family enzyme
MTAEGTVRGVDHVGITVVDISTATDFFRAAFDATVIYDLMVDGALVSDGGRFGPIEFVRGPAYNMPKGARIHAVRMLGLPQGPGIELFEYRVEGQREPVRPCDLGLQHFALYVDDMTAAIASAQRAGAALITGPNRLFGLEESAGGAWAYVEPPWGGSIELITFPAAQRYESTTDLRRWRPPSPD